MVSIESPIRTDPIMPPVASDQGDMQFLAALGRRVREIRDRRGMPRKQLARAASVSERYLSQLESGDGNISIILLRRVALALHVALPDLLTAEHEQAVESRLIRRLLERLPQARQEEVIQRLMRDFAHDESARRKRVALIGLRGAGKSTLGRLLARDRAVPFIELDQEIERELGMPAGEIFALYGQAGYRRAEKRCLERTLADNECAVLSLGGGLVAQSDSYETLLAHCYTVWVRATPAEHMARVVAQGDLRPMAGNAEAMLDLQRILSAREPLYRRADAMLDTSGEPVESSFVELQRLTAA